MKKLGPLSTDIVVACMVHEFQKKGEQAEFSKIVKGLKGLVSQATISKDLGTLEEWGIVQTEFGETDKGHAGRIYLISGEAEDMVAATYDKYWSLVMKEKK